MCVSLVTWLMLVWGFFPHSVIMSALLLGDMSLSDTEMQAEDHMTPVNHSLLTSHEL